MISSTRNLNDMLTNQSRNHPVEIEVEVKVAMLTRERESKRAGEEGVEIQT